MIPIDIAHTKDIEQNLVDEIILDINKITPEFSLSDHNPEDIPKNHFYGYEITAESQLKSLYKRTKSRKLFLLDCMIVTHNGESYVIEPAACYQTPDRQKRVYVVSTFMLNKNPEGIAKLAVHEILHHFFEENFGEDFDFHCEKNMCIMNKTKFDDDFTDVNHPENFYKRFREELDHITGLCSYHRGLIKKVEKISKKNN